MLIWPKKHIYKLFLFVNINLHSTVINKIIPCNLPLNEKINVLLSSCKSFFFGMFKQRMFCLQVSICNEKISHEKRTRMIVFGMKRIITKLEFVWWGYEANDLYFLVLTFCTWFAFSTSSNSESTLSNSSIERWTSSVPLQQNGLMRLRLNLML